MSPMLTVACMSFCAGMLCMALLARHAVQVLRRTGLPGCRHDGSAYCGKCNKRLVGVGQDNSGPGVASDPCVMVYPSPERNDHLRVALKITDEFCPWVDMTADSAQAFFRSALTTVVSLRHTDGE